MVEKQKGGKTQFERPRKLYIYIYIYIYKTNFPSHIILFKDINYYLLQ
jgi:hypothetical protein